MSETNEINKSEQASEILGNVLQDYYDKCGEAEMSTELIMQILFRTAIMSTYMTYLAGKADPDEVKEYLHKEFDFYLADVEARYEAEYVEKEDGQ